MAADAESAGSPAESAAIARLRDGTEVGAWMFKANPAVWDIGAALAAGVELDWWRMAPGYRSELVAPGQPCAVWVTRGDDRVRSGVWAVGRIDGPVIDDTGDPDDPLWRDEEARRQVRPRVPLRMRVLSEPVRREMIMADPRLERCEVLRVPRIGNPATLTVPEWTALVELVEQVDPAEPTEPGAP